MRCVQLFCPALILDNWSTNQIFKKTSKPQLGYLYRGSGKCGNDTLDYQLQTQSDDRTYAGLVKFWKQGYKYKNLTDL